MTKLVMLFVLLCSGLCVGENWPGWRGERGDGTCIETSVPTRWSDTENVLWKTAIVGKGHSSPIVWGDRIFLTTAIKDTNQRLLLCLDRETGKVLWRRAVLNSPPERKHSLNSYASSTPVTDGKKVYVSFLDRDKMFVAAYDFEGNVVWQQRPGVFSSVHGYCSSPILWKDKVILNGDHDGPAYIVALDRADGKTVWKTPRPNRTRSYCVPIIRTIDRRNQMILSGSKCVASYDPDTGKQHWIIDGPTQQYVASIVYNGDMLFMTCGFPDLYIQAIRPDWVGNITRTHVVWQKDRDCSYVPSPVVIGPYFIVVDDNGVLSCFEAKSGKRFWRERLRGRHSASLLSANGLVYILSDKGAMTILRPGEEFEVVGRNELGEETNASPVVSGRKLFLRGDKHLYCIGVEVK